MRDYNNVLETEPSKPKQYIVLRLCAMNLALSCGFKGHLLIIHL